MRAVWIRASVAGAVACAVAVGAAVALVALPEAAGAATSPPASSTYVPTTATRVADTRVTMGANRAGAVRPNGSTSFSVAGAPGYPSTATAVAVTLTALDPTVAGRLAATANASSTTGDVGNVYFNPGRAASDTAVVPLTPGTGRIRVWNGSARAIHVTVDVKGFYVPADAASGSAADAGLWHVLPYPGRVVDTRSKKGGSGALAAHSSRVVTIDHTADSWLPTDSTTVAAEQVELTVFPAGGNGSISNKYGDPVLRFAEGQYTSAAVTVRTDNDAAFTVTNNSGVAVHIAVDVQAYVTAGPAEVAGGVQEPLPTRVAAPAKPAPGRPATVNAVRAGGVPAGARAALVTLTDFAPPGYVSYTAWASGAQPRTVDMIGQKGIARTQEALVPLDANGRFLLGASAATSVNVSVLGYVTGSGVPAAKGSSAAHYVDDQIKGDGNDGARMSTLGAADGKAGQRFVLLQVGAQTVSSPLSAAKPGVAVANSSNNAHVTYADVVSDVQAYVDGYRAQAPDGALELAVGTSNSGVWTSSATHGTAYNDVDRGRAWADQVVDRLAGYKSVTVDGANDIEPTFGDRYVSTQAQALNWVKTFTASTAARFVNNGAAVGCPATPGTTGGTCANGYTQSGLYEISVWGNNGDTVRSVVLPQIYARDNATQWATLSSAGRSGLTFLGGLSEYPPNVEPENLGDEGRVDLYRALDSLGTPPSLYGPQIG